MTFMDSVKLDAHPYDKTLLQCVNKNRYGVFIGDSHEETAHYLRIMGIG